MWGESAGTQRRRGRGETQRWRKVAADVNRWRVSVLESTPSRFDKRGYVFCNCVTCEWLRMGVPPLPFAVLPEPPLLLQMRDEVRDVLRT